MNAITILRIILFPFNLVRMAVGLALFPEYIPQCWRAGKVAWAELKAEWGKRK
jgi:hypothetical protein